MKRQIELEDECIAYLNQLRNAVKRMVGILPDRISASVYSDGVARKALRLAEGVVKFVDKLLTSCPKESHKSITKLLGNFSHHRPHSLMCCHFNSRFNHLLDIKLRFVSDHCPCFRVIKVKYPTDRHTPFDH